SEIDVAVDSAGEARDRHVGNSARVRQRPERRLESDRANRARHPAGVLEAIAIDRPDVGADIGVLGYVTIEAVAHFDLEVLRGDLFQKLLGLMVSSIDDCDDPKQLVEGDWDRRRFYRAGNHDSAPSVTQSTR